MCPFLVKTIVTPGVGPLQGSPSRQIAFGMLTVPRRPESRVAETEPAKAVAATAHVAARTAAALTMSRICPRTLDSNLAALVASSAKRLCSPPMAVGDVMTVRIVSVTPQASVQEAIARMLEEGIGSVAVCDGPRLVGIFTERDVLRCAGEGSMFGDVAVGDVMTRRPVTVSADDDVLGAAQLMASKRIRHLPVCEGDFLIGMVGIRDVLRGLIEQAAERHGAARETARALLTRAAR